MGALRRVVCLSKRIIGMTTDFLIETMEVQRQWNEETDYMEHQKNEISEFYSRKRYLKQKNQK